MTGWAATKGTRAPSEIELAAWRIFATRVVNMPPLDDGKILMGRRLKLVDCDTDEVLPFGPYDPERPSLSPEAARLRARLLGAGP